MPITKDPTELVLGRCDVTFDGVTLGHTLGGCVVNVATELQDLKVDDYGNSVLDKVVSGLIVTVKVPLAQDEYEVFAKAFPVGTDSASKVTMGGTVGKLLSTESGELVLHPAKNDSDDLLQDVVLWKAVAEESGDVTFKVDEQLAVEVTFTGLVDTSRSDGDMIAMFGDSNT